jgi:ABC-2 type transport system ATP-binding protein
MTSANNQEAFLEIKGLTKSYGDLYAVKELSLEIYKGEIFGFLGPNGAGKTTAISMLCGLLKQDSGEVYIEGKRVDNHYEEYKHKLGLCPQNLVIWESLTCLEQLEIMGGFYNIKRNIARKKALELLDALGLNEKQYKLAKTLSGGMKRRLNIALALVHDPEILILDEPQAGLDPQSRILVRDYIRSLVKKTTIILTTHEMDEADRLADRVAIIDHGQLLALDTPGNLKNQIGQGDILEAKIFPGQEDNANRLMQNLPGSLNLMTLHENTLRLVGQNMVDALPGLLETFQNNHLKIEDISIRKKTLEDVFIALTGRRLRE